MAETGGTGHHEQRRFKRSKLEMLVGVIHGGKFGFEYSIEVSEGGMLLGIYEKYAVGDIIDISFFIPPTGEVVLVRGEICYTLEPQPGKRFAGVRFTDPSPSSRALIRRYVSANERQE